MTGEVIWRPTIQLRVVSLAVAAAWAATAIGAFGSSGGRWEPIWHVAMGIGAVFVVAFVAGARITTAGLDLEVRGPFNLKRVRLADILSCSAKEGNISIHLKDGEISSSIAQRVPMWKRETRGDRICDEIMRRADLARQAQL